MLMIKVSWVCLAMTIGIPLDSEPAASRQSSDIKNSSFVPTHVPIKFQNQSGSQCLD